METAIFGIPAILIIYVIFKLVMSTICNLGERSEKRFGKFKSIHEGIVNTSKEAFIAAHDNDIEAAKRSSQLVKSLPIKAAKLTTKGLYLCTKYAFKGLNVAKKLYFETDKFFDDRKKNK